MNEKTVDYTLQVIQNKNSIHLHACKFCRMSNPYYYYYYHFITVITHLHSVISSNIIPLQINICGVQAIFYHVLQVPFWLRSN